MAAPLQIADQYNSLRTVRSLLLTSGGEGPIWSSEIRATAIWRRDREAIRLWSPCSSQSGQIIGGPIHSGLPSLPIVRQECSMPFGLSLSNEIRKVI